LGDAYQMIRSAFQIVYPLILNEKPRLSEKIVMKLGSIFFPPQK
jgi:hypothetical protein